MATSRAHPTPRNEGMANIVSATIRLLETRTPQDVTLRDVAHESGHGHRLIVKWFGGKGGLFAAVVNETFEKLSASGELFYADLPLRRDVRIVFQVFNYMQIHHPEFVRQARTRLPLSTAEQRLTTNLGIPPERARIVIHRLSLQLLGIALFREFFELSDDEVIRMMQDEFRTTTGFELADNPNRIRDEDH